MHNVHINMIFHIFSDLNDSCATQYVVFLAFLKSKCFKKIILSGCERS